MFDYMLYRANKSGCHVGKSAQTEGEKENYVQERTEEKERVNETKSLK
jgi:hypothetical protein